MSLSPYSARMGQPITVVLHEQLGNQLFQWAAGYALSERLRVRLNVVITNYGRSGDYCMLRRFPISAKLLNPLPGLVFERVFKQPMYQMQRYTERFGDTRGADEPPLEVSTFRDKFHDLPAGTLLNGMFQSWRYFHDHRDGILRELTLSETVLDLDGTETLKRIQGSRSVAIHVRRGDYVVSGSRSQFDVCGYDYFRRCINFVSQHVRDATFFVFSDDIGWCRRHIRADRLVYCSSEKKRDPLIDFFLISRCCHQIICNSTYSWWAAYLNQAAEKLVLCPDRWFNVPGAPIEDKICPTWIPIPVDD
jgi:hypothetical protein